MLFNNVIWLFDILLFWGYVNGEFFFKKLIIFSFIFLDGIILLIDIFFI